MTTHTERDFEQLMNEIHAPADIAGFKYEAGYALRLVDPILFRQAYLDWLDSENIPDGYEGIDFDTLPEDVKGMEIVHYRDIKDTILTDGGWDFRAVVSEDGRTITTVIDSTNLDEYEYDDQSGLYVSPFGPEMCAGCVDYTVYNYDFKTHSWNEFDSALFEYYPGDTLESFFLRNRLI